MTRNSITLKLLLLIIGAFVTMSVSILLIADNQLIRIIDESQHDLYEEKIEVILGSLHRSNERLKKTGLVEAYGEDFREASLKVLRQTYYEHPDQPIYPFIIDTDGVVVMHPKLPEGDLSLEQTVIVKKMLSSSEGDFDYIYQGQEKWYHFMQFPEWNWVIGYTVPLDIKYADARRLRNILALIIVLISAAVLLLLSWIISRFTKPIIQLTNVSSEIAAGNLDQAIEIDRKDEIGTLASSFSDMRDSIRKKISELEQENAERKRAEEERERLFRDLKLLNSELEQIIYITSHDLRSPLVNVEGYSRELGITLDEILAVIESEDVPAEVKSRLKPYVSDIPESLKFIGKSVSKMDSLLMGVLQFSRTGRAELKIAEIDMNSILSEITMAFDFQIRDTGAKVDVAELPRCYGDRDQVNQVFSNLFGNSLKYLSPDREGVIKVYGYTEDDRSVYCIEDNGIGVSTEYREKIFDIFHQLEPTVTGEGLGLTIVRKIVEMHGGKVWMESGEGKGSKFFVALPQNN